MLAISWFIPAILLFYYVDTNRRAQDTFTNGLRYAVELSSERLSKVYERASGISTDNIQDIYDNHDGFVFVTLERSDMGVLDFGNSADYAAYIANDREKLIEAMDVAGTQPLLYISEGGSLYAARWRFADYETKRRRTGILVAELDKAYVFSYLTENMFGASSIDVELGEATIFFVENEEGKLVIAETAARGYANGAGVVGAVGGGQLAMSYHGVIDRSSLFGDYWVMSVIFYSLFIICPLFLILSLFLYKSVSKPVTRLMEAIEALNRGDFGVRIDEGAGDEFSRLSHAFNTMSASLSESLEREKEKDAASKDSRLLALRAQINPHFINNSLEFLNWKARMNDADGVSSMVTALSQLLEGAMGREGDSLLPLKKELVYAQAYLSVIKMRFSDRAFIRIDIADEVLGCLVPPLILQPLLENAVVHGIEPRGEGAIDLIASYDTAALKLRVINDGGLTEYQIERLGRSFKRDAATRRLGVSNVAERLHLLFGGAAKFEVFEEDGRTVAQILITY